MRILTSILSLFCLGALGQPVTVRWNISDFTLTPQGLKRIYITPIGAPFVYTNIASADRRTFTNDANGTLTVSNIITPGSYEVDFLGSYQTLSFTNTFPATNAGSILDAKDWISTGTNNPDGSLAYSIASANARFALLFTGLNTNLDILFPGPRTNRLQFSNGVLTNVTSTP